MPDQPGNVACPHCGGANQREAAFCAACGKALPVRSGPRVVGKGALASTSAGQKVQSEELQKTLKKASGALLTVAILQAVFGTIIVLIARQNTTIPVTAYVMIYGIAAAFCGLYFWARVAPLPAAIVGLVLFVTVHLLDALADPTALFRGIIVKVFIIAILVQAISAGVQYNRLKDSQR
jgi:hypothetical protein